jgi:DNA transposition AAA+ family ATPase
MSYRPVHRRGAGRDLGFAGRLRSRRPGRARPIPRRVLHPTVTATLGELRDQLVTLTTRVGFAHHYRPLTGEELIFVLTRHWRALGLDTADFTDTQAIATIARITGGDFRLIHHLFVQIKRVLKINELATITSDVVEAARSTLVIGAT